MRVANFGSGIPRQEHGFAKLRHAIAAARTIGEHLPERLRRQVEILPI